MIRIFIHYQVWNINFAFKKCDDELGLLASKITWLFPQKIQIYIQDNQI